MQVSLLVKKQNLRKHNSHEWFMAAFAKELDCKCKNPSSPALLVASRSFLTDCLQLQTSSAPTARQCSMTRC